MTRATPTATSPSPEPTTGPAEPPPPPPSPRRRRVPGRTSACAALTLAALAAAVAPHPAGPWVALALSTGVVGWGGWPLLRAARAGLHRGGSTVDVLPGAGLLALCGTTAWAVAHGTTGPVPLVTAAAATTLVLAGARALDRTAAGVDAELRALDAGRAEVTAVRADGAVRLDAADLKVGDRFAVGPGERAVVGGVVVEGRSAAQVEEAEAPVEVGPGDAVPSGARNVGDRLVVEVTDTPPQAGTGSVDVGPPAAEAQRGAAVLHGVADRAARGFAAIVVLLAVATLGFWLGAGAGPGPALGAAAAVLLVACPRAAGGAASTALLAATARAVELGALPAAPRVLERAARVDTVVLCGTGTVTTGVRRVGTVHVAADVDRDEALRLAGALAVAAREAGGEPGTADNELAAVVAAEAQERFDELPGVADLDACPGLGARGVVTELRADADGKPWVIAHAVLLGHADLLTEHGVDLPPELGAALERAHLAGVSTVAVSWDGVARAVLEVADPVRPGAAAAVRRLRGLGLRPVLLTGEDAAAARGLATALGIDSRHVLAGVDPDGRAGAVGALRARGATVAVLGGPADAAALAAADVALVRPGSDAPTGGSTGSPGTGIALRDDDPLTAVDGLRVARRAVRTVEHAVTGALAYHLATLPLAATGLLPPLVAVAAAATVPVAGVTYASALRRLRALPRP